MAGTGPVGVGFIGTGMISNTYLENLTRFPDIDVIILGDLTVERGQGPGGAARGAGSGAPPMTCSTTPTSSWWST